MSQPRTPDAHDDGGFTLVELLVGMTLSIIVLLGVLATLDAFGSSAAANNRLTAAQDTSRRVMDQMVGQVSSATRTSASGGTIGPIERQSAYDVIIVSAPWTPGSGTGTTAVPGAVGTALPTRYCLDSAGTLWSGTQTTYPAAAYAAPPVAAGTIPTTAECTNTMSGAWSYDVVARNLNPAQTSLAGDARRRTVGITLALNVVGRPNPLVLRSSATARNTLQTPTVVASDFVCTKKTGTLTTKSVWTIAPVGGGLTDSDGAPITVDFFGPAPNRIALGSGSAQVGSGGTQSIGIKETSVASASAITDISVGCPS